MSRIYDTVPDRPQSDPELRDMVRDILLDNKIPVKAAKIGEMCGIKRTEGSVKVHLAITELVHYDKLPIVANARGYFIATTEEQIDKYVRDLENRRDGIARRIYDIDRARISVQMAREGILV